MITEWRK